MCKVVNIIILFDGCERFSLVIMQLLPTSHGKASFFYKLKHKMALFLSMIPVTSQRFDLCFFYYFWLTYGTDTINFGIVSLVMNALTSLLLPLTPTCCPLAYLHCPSTPPHCPLAPHHPFCPVTLFHCSVRKMPPHQLLTHPVTL